jgi:predicted DNA-binding protein with PD1-like motif
MVMLKTMEPVKRLWGRLSFGSDLLQELSAVCQKEGVHLGWFTALGAVSKACFSYYEQEKREYRPLVIDRPLEITHLVGNVSLKDGNPFVHAHVTVADSEGRTYGGHLATGTIVFACEFVLEVLNGPALERVFDDTTGLYLWKD